MLELGVLVLLESVVYLDVLVQPVRLVCKQGSLGPHGPGTGYMDMALSALVGHTGDRGIGVQMKVAAH